MKAKEQKEIKGIYFNEMTDDIYFVNKVNSNLVNVSLVLTNSIGGMIKVTKSNFNLSLDVFKEFTFSGNYSRKDINN